MTLLKTVRWLKLAVKLLYRNYTLLSLRLCESVVPVSHQPGRQ